MIAEMVNSISVVCLCRVSNHVGTQGIIIFWDINMPIFKAWLNMNDILQCCFRHSLYSSVAERQSCKLKVLGSIPSGGYCRTRQARSKTTTTDHKPNQRGTMRTPGVEPGSQAWKACMIPLHYVRHSPPNATNDTRCPAARPTKPDMRKPN